ncbi:MAG: DUF3800 domain-containing protein, partial [Anaerolineae bacterium]|nr:DUF3800 domain-containing protein [Anaerolineae bacterium]
DAEFREVFNIIRARVPVQELKGEQIYRGRGAWKNIEPQVRDRVIEFYLSWIAQRNHRFIVTAIDNDKYFSLRESEPDNPFIQAIPYPYLLAGLHIAMVVQKQNKRKKKNKGKTILIFDEQKTKGLSEQLANLIFDPPEFIDDFVSFDEKKEGTRLNQIIDTAFFVSSHHSSMAQVVDIVAYLYRLYLELTEYGFDEAYEGERDKIATWIGQIEDKFLPHSVVYPKKNARFVQFINSVRARGAYQ